MERLNKRQIVIVEVGQFIEQFSMKYSLRDIKHHFYFNLSTIVAYFMLGNRILDDSEEITPEMETLRGIEISDERARMTFGYFENGDVRRIQYKCVQCRKPLDDWKIFHLRKCELKVTQTLLNTIEELKEHIKNQAKLYDSRVNNLQTKYLNSLYAQNMYEKMIRDQSK